MKKFLLLFTVFSFTPFLFSQDVTPTNKEICPKCEANKCVFKDDSAKKYCEVDSEDANCFKEGFAAVKIGSKWGYINIKGEVVVKPEFEGADDFNEGFAVIKIGNKHGYINSSGQVIINPQYDTAKAFHENYARVSINDKYGFIDKTGNIKIKLIYDLAYNFNEGMAAVSTWDDDKIKWSFINKQGLQVIKQKYDGVQAFHEGLAAVKIIDKWGFIDKTGKLIIEPLFDENSVIHTSTSGGMFVGDDGLLFYNGKASGELNGETVSINNKGEIIGVGSDTNDPFVNSILIASTYLQQAQKYVIDNKSIKAEKNRNLALKTLSKVAVFGKIIDSEKICPFTHEMDSVWGWHFFTLSLDEKRKVLFWFSKEKGMLINNPQYFTSKKVFEQIENMKDGEEVNVVIKIVKNIYGKPFEINNEQ